MKVSSYRPIVMIGAIMLAVASSGPIAARQDRTPTSVLPQDPREYSAEFPPTDGAILSELQAGFDTKRAVAQLRAPQSSPEVLRLLISRDRLDDALRALRTVVAGPPALYAAAFAVAASEGYRFTMDQSRGYDTELSSLAGAARARLGELPREEAAKAARQLLSVENIAQRSGSNSWDARVNAFIAEYTGTKEAESASIDLMGRGRITMATVDAYDAYAKAHAGTEGAAHALYLESFQLAENIAITGVEPRGSDPTERFLRVIDIVTQLESGAYPSCEWVTRAPQSVTQFFVSNIEQAKFLPGNLDRMIAAYGQFVRTHFVLDDRSPMGNGIGYVINSKMTQLFKLKGEGPEALEPMFDELEKSSSTPDAVRFTRAEFDISHMHGDLPSARQYGEKAIDVLTALSDHGSPLYQRKALATLASTQFYERNYAQATTALKAYLSRYPHTPWSWVAAIRLGQICEETGDWPSAIKAYAGAATTYSSIPLANVLGHALAANADDATQQFDRARVEYQAAADAWDTDYSAKVFVPVSHAPKPGVPSASAPIPASSEVTQDVIAQRLTVLRGSAGKPGGSDLERGRWLVARKQYDEAVAPLRTVVSLSPASPLAGEAQRLLHRSQLFSALTHANIEAQPPTSADTTRAALEALAREPWDESVAGAEIAGASLLWTQGDKETAQPLMDRALSDWRAHQTSSGKPTSLESDLIGVRDAVFRPMGGGVYGVHGWNGFEWPSAMPAFLVVHAQMQVKTSDGQVAHVTLTERPSNLDVLFVTSADEEMLNMIITSLGGTKTRAPGAVMETPNQPVGPSMDILSLWNRFFPSRAGHWGGWVFDTYPIVSQIEFTNPERTKANAAVTIGYAGATVMLEKTNGVWTAVKLVNQWVT